MAVTRRPDQGAWETKPHSETRPDHMGASVDFGQQTDHARRIGIAD